MSVWWFVVNVVCKYVCMFGHNVSTHYRLLEALINLWKYVSICYVRMYLWMLRYVTFVSSRHAYFNGKCELRTHTSFCLLINISYIALFVCRYSTWIYILIRLTHVNGDGDGDGDEFVFARHLMHSTFHFTFRLHNARI